VPQLRVKENFSFSYLFRVFRFFVVLYLFHLKEKRTFQSVFSLDISIFSWSLCPGRGLPCLHSVRN